MSTNSECEGAQVGVQEVSSARATSLLHRPAASAIIGRPVRTQRGSPCATSIARSMNRSAGACRRSSTSRRSAAAAGPASRRASPCIARTNAATAPPTPMPHCRPTPTGCRMRCARSACNAETASRSFCRSARNGGRPHRDLPAGRRRDAAVAAVRPRRARVPAAGQRRRGRDRRRDRAARDRVDSRPVVRT